MILDDDDIVGQINWDGLFDELPAIPSPGIGFIADGYGDGDGSSNLNLPPSEVSVSPCSWIDEIENLLMDDTFPVPLLEGPADSTSKEYCNNFVAEVLVESRSHSHSHGDRDGEVVETPCVEETSNPSDKDADFCKDKVDADAVAQPAPAHDDDPISKKRTRQMRNRDAAVRSRERKKMCVRNLEMKSRYLEGECKRLGYLLQCCYAENHALRLCLQSGNAFGASMTKLESAVLLLESLLLGSLLWHVGIMCLFPLAPLPRLTREVMSLENIEKKGFRRVTLTGARNKILGYLVVQPIVKSRRCRSSRTKMKFILPVF
ncbi:hypothetical protein L6164_015167 [Bauhinia variegata]|uniref:Uncharacterized protein n=1 Tax=Bauhinia variegata TaxID=167791 RepID=A0ACB9NJU2_BAUVA|nr:hypothetical protein L6164_015167 [Bauhinia variegata]